MTSDAASKEGLVRVEGQCPACESRAWLRFEALGRELTCKKCERNFLALPVAINDPGPATVVARPTASGVVAVFTGRYLELGDAMRVRVEAPTINDAIAQARARGIVTLCGDAERAVAAATTMTSGSAPGRSGDSKQTWVAVACVAIIIVATIAAIMHVRESDRRREPLATARTHVSEAPALVPERTHAAAPRTPPNCVRGPDGRWQPEAGYEWDRASRGEFAVRWVSGVRHPSYPNVTSATKVDYWNADPGYDFVERGKLTVRWIPAKGHPRYANIVSADKPGYWRPQPGYQFIKSGDLRVRWQPGASHPQVEHVIAGSDAGKWRPASGYTWAHPTRANDLSVVPAGPTDEQIASAAMTAVIALLAQAASDATTPTNFVEGLLKEGLLELRTQALKESVTQLFPHEDRAAIDAAVRIIAMAVDGKLNAKDWKSRSTRDALLRRLEAAAPDLANGVRIVQFIATVLDAYDRRR